MVILDTCTLLWLASDLNKLSTTAKIQIIDNKGLIYVSAISAIEIGVKCRKKKLKLKMDPKTWFRKALEQHGVEEIAVNSSIAVSATELPMIHNDPMDRIIIATAMKNNFTILTPDDTISKYPSISAVW